MIEGEMYIHAWRGLEKPRHMNSRHVVNNEKKKQMNELSLSKFPTRRYLEETQREEC